MSFDVTNSPGLINSNLIPQLERSKSRYAAGSAIAGMSVGIITTVALATLGIILGAAALGSCPALAIPAVCVIIGAVVAGPIMGLGTFSLSQYKAHKTFAEFTEKHSIDTLPDQSVEGEAIVKLMDMCDDEGRKQLFAQMNLQQQWHALKGKDTVTIEKYINEINTEDQQDKMKLVLALKELSSNDLQRDLRNPENIQKAKEDLIYRILILEEVEGEAIVKLMDMCDDEGRKQLFAHMNFQQQWHALKKDPATRKKYLSDPENIQKAKKNSIYYQGILKDLLTLKDFDNLRVFINKVNGFQAITSLS